MKAAFGVTECLEGAPQSTDHLSSWTPTGNVPVCEHTLENAQDCLEK